MKITLVKPNVGRLEHSLFVDEARMEPLQLGVLAGLTPKDVEVVMYDDRVEQIPFDEHTDLAAITVETYTARRAYEISAEYRKRGIPVIMGGMHATLIPEEVQEHADSLFIGDAESLWETVISDARNGKLESLYKAPVGIPHPGVLPRRDIFKGKGYLPVSLMQFGRGCRFPCDFCAISVYFDKKQYYRRVDEVLMEIDSQARKNIFFVDDNLISNQQAAKLFFKELAGMNIRWVSQASIDMTRDLELMDLMVNSGCIANVIGFESITKDSLRLMKKAPNLMRGFHGYEEPIRILRDYGLQTWAAFTLGHDFDTIQTIRGTVDFAMENKFTFAAFNILMPYPNTPLYERLDEAGRHLYDGKWWLHPEYRFNHAAFTPSQLTPEELTSEAFRARTLFNSYGSLFRRMFEPKTNMRSLVRLAFFLLYTPLFRKETFKKQGMHFGYH